MKYSKEQIIESIKYYSNCGKYSPEKVRCAINHWKNVLMTEHQLSEQELNEGLLKTVAGSVKDLAKNVASTVSDKVASAIEKVHDMVATNEGTKFFLDNIAKLNEDGIDLSKVKLAVSIGKATTETTFPVIDFDLNSKKNNLILMFKGRKKDSGKIVTVEQMREALKKAGIKKMSRSIDGITCIPVKETKLTKDSETNLPLADNNKLLEVKFNGKDVLTFLFAESKSNVKAKQANDDIFS